MIDQLPDAYVLRPWKLGNEARQRVAQVQLARRLQRQHRDLREHLANRFCGVARMLRMRFARLEIGPPPSPHELVAPVLDKHDPAEVAGPRERREVAIEGAAKIR